MNAKEARKLGWTVVRGSYSGTHHDRLDRWYLQHVDADVVDRRHGGYETRADAYEELWRHLEVAT